MWMDAEYWKYLKSIFTNKYIFNYNTISFTFVGLYNP